MKILGAFEPVSLPSFGITNVIAKVDTGAFTGAMHATEISEASHDRRLRFKPLGYDKPVTVTSYYRRVVKSSTGHTEERYCIPVKMKIQGKFYEMNISLTNRSNMKYPIIIGRRFIKDTGFVVDVTKGAQYGAGKVV
jgi:hypothetical protein